MEQEEIDEVEMAGANMILDVAKPRKPAKKRDTGKGDKAQTNKSTEQTNTGDAAQTFFGTKRTDLSEITGLSLAEYKEKYMIKSYDDVPLDHVKKMTLGTSEELMEWVKASTDTVNPDWDDVFEYLQKAIE